MNMLNPADIAVVSLATDEIADIRDLSFPNKEDYCRRHGYRWFGFTQRLDAARHPSWNKILYLQQVLPDFKWVFWTDADSIVCNPTVPLESFIDESTEFIISVDCMGLNAGHMFLKNCPNAFLFLRDVYACPPHLINGGLWEQTAIVKLVSAGKQHVNKKIVPQNDFNAYPESRPDSKCFIMHWPGRTEQARLMREKLATL